MSPLLFGVISMAQDMAAASGGAFDLTVGAAQRARGFDRNYLTHAAVSVAAETASYHDLRLDRDRCTILLHRPLLLDLGAVAKGMVIDPAARELTALERFFVDAGGVVYAGGAARRGKPWRVGVQDPESDRGLLGVLQVWYRAVCASGGSERRLDNGGHHLLDPCNGETAAAAVGVTTVATTALAADALATAAFVLGADQGLQLLRESDVEGLVELPGNEIRCSAGLARKHH